MIARCDIGEPVSCAPCQWSSPAGDDRAVARADHVLARAVPDFADAGHDVQHLVARVTVPARAPARAKLHHLHAQLPGGGARERPRPHLAALEDGRVRALDRLALVRLQNMQRHARLLVRGAA